MGAAEALAEISTIALLVTMRVRPLAPGSRIGGPRFPKLELRCPTVARVQPWSGHSPQLKPVAVAQKASDLSGSKKGASRPTMDQLKHPIQYRTSLHTARKRPSTLVQTNAQTRPRLGRASLCPPDGYHGHTFCRPPPAALASLSPPAREAGVV